VTHVSELLVVFTPNEEPLDTTSDMVELLEPSEQTDPLPYTFGDPEVIARLDALCTEYSDIFSTKLSLQPADIPLLEVGCFELAISPTSNSHLRPIRSSAEIT
jgi:hypothetical protein